MLTKRSGQWARMAGCLAGILALAGCGHVKTSEVVSPLNYTVPGKDIFPAQLDKVFACMKATGALKRQGFAVGPFANDTGKSNAATTGGTGSFLPRGPNIAIYAMEAISRAGGVVYDYSNLDIARNIAFMGGQSAARHLHKLQNKNMPNFGVNVFATALDFGGMSTADLRIGGIGPIAMHTNANAYYGAHIVQPGSQRSLARGFAVFQANYTEAGVGVSRFFGGGTGTLVTGSVSLGNQQPLQRPTAEGVMVSVAYALLEIPALSKCRETMTPFELLSAKNQKLNQNKNKSSDKSGATGT